MRLKHVCIVTIVFFIFLILGCSNTTVKEGKGLESEFPPTMNGLVRIDGIEYLMEEGNYHWERKKGLETEVVSTDHASPYQMANQIKSISAKPNETIDIKIEGEPEISVYLWDENGREKEIEQAANQITVPSSKGKYIYEVLAEWSNGTVSYAFVIDNE